MEQFLIKLLEAPGNGTTIALSAFFLVVSLVIISYLVRALREGEQARTRIVELLSKAPTEQGESWGHMVNELQEQIRSLNSDQHSLRNLISEQAQQLASQSERVTLQNEIIANLRHQLRDAIDARTVVMKILDESDLVVETLKSEVLRLTTRVDQLEKFLELKGIEAPGEK